MKRQRRVIGIAGTGVAGVEEVIGPAVEIIGDETTTAYEALRMAFARGRRQGRALWSFIPVDHDDIVGSTDRRSRGDRTSEPIVAVLCPKWEGVAEFAVGAWKKRVRDVPDLIAPAAAVPYVSIPGKAAHGVFVRTEGPARFRRRAGRRVCLRRGQGPCG